MIDYAAKNVSAAAITEDPEVQAVFNMAVLALIMDYMYMGTETDQDGFKYLLFKHIETREYIKIAERVKS